MDIWLFWTFDQLKKWILKVKTEVSYAFYSLQFAQSAFALEQED